MLRRIGIGGEVLATFAAATLSGIACCGPPVLQWPGFLVWAAGGRALLMGLGRYEVPVLLVIAAASYLGRVMAEGRLMRWANALLAGTAFLLAALRLVWDMRRGLVMAIDPLYQLFIDRQAALLVVAGLVFTIRLALLLAGLRWRGSPLPAPQRGGSKPSWTYRTCSSVDCVQRLVER